MFGYKKGEIEGKNVSLLMPQPFSNKHNSFLRNYTTTGKAKILNTNREVGCCRRCQKQLSVGALDYHIFWQPAGAACEHAGLKAGDIVPCIKSIP